MKRLLSGFILLASLSSQASMKAQYSSNTSWLWDKYLVKTYDSIELNLKAYSDFVQSGEELNLLYMTKLEKLSKSLTSESLKARMKMYISETKEKLKTAKDKKTNVLLDQNSEFHRVARQLITLRASGDIESQQEAEDRLREILNDPTLDFYNFREFLYRSDIKRFGREERDYNYRSYNTGNPLDLFSTYKFFNFSDLVKHKSCQSSNIQFKFITSSPALLGSITENRINERIEEFTEFLVSLDKFMIKGNPTIKCKKTNWYSEKGIEYKASENTFVITDWIDSGSIFPYQLVGGYNQGYGAINFNKLFIDTIK